MSKTTIIMVCENPEWVEGTKKYFEGKDVALQVFSPFQWRDGLESPYFRQQLLNGVPALVGGANHSGAEFSNIVTFGNGGSDTRVAKMEELEAKAIENAIMQYKGNLTEAAKALGIGRATLYRKVKQYQIDPSLARKKRAA